MKLKHLLFLSLLSLPLSSLANERAHRIPDINQMTQAQYEEQFKEIFEDAPWVIAESAKKRPFTGFVDMYENTIEIVKQRDRATQIELIKTHPTLACKSVRAADIAAYSKSEQSGAGLNTCTEQESNHLAALNQQYAEKFGYPFLMAVKGYNKSEIFTELQRRLNNDPQLELDTSLQQLYKIILLRMLNEVR